MIDQQLEAARVQDVKIQQKLGAAHREAFQQKFPGQVEHCMRLVAERLQSGLRKDSDMQLSDCSAKDLTWALLNLWTIHNDIQDLTGR
jgi:hypothetical protein